MEVDPSRSHNGLSLAQHQMNGPIFIAGPEPYNEKYFAQFYIINSSYIFKKMIRKTVYSKVGVFIYFSISTIFKEVEKLH